MKMTVIKRIINVSREQRVVATSSNQIAKDEPAFLIYHSAFEKILGSGPTLTLALEEVLPYFHEAGVYIPLRDSLLVTSNQFVPSGKEDKTILISEICRQSNGSWMRQLIKTDIPMANGGINYQGGVLFCAQGDKQKHGALVHMQLNAPYATRTLVDNYFGRRFNSVNDVVVHSDGSIWFTDPIYGFEQGIRPEPELPNQVYRFDPVTGDVRVVADGFGRPNGIAFSPDEQTVYITDTEWIHGDGSTDLTRHSTIYAFDVITRHSSQFLTNRRVFAMADTGIPDGIKCDTVGNVYSGTGDGLSVWNAGGVLLGKVLVPGGVANFCFGRSGELFLLNEKRFWVAKIAGNVKGALLENMGVRVDEVNAKI